jgi:hypothetical protein
MEEGRGVHKVLVGKPERIFEPKRDGVTGEWRKLHNDVVNELYSSPNILRVIKLRRMRWVRHMALVE